jgi:hypothetical protein
MRRTIAVLLLALLAACGTMQNYRVLDQAAGPVLTASVGGTIFRLNRSSDLPNAFGKADVFGGKVDRGYAELKFLGVNEKGELLLSVTDINKSSHETTMDRYGNRPAVQVQTNVAVGSSSSPESMRFLFDPRKQKELIIAGVKVVFVDVQPYSVSYRVEDIQK